MEKTIQIHCKNNGQTYQVPMGCSLEEAYQQLGLSMTFEPILAHVNNKVEGMHYRI